MWQLIIFIVLLFLIWSASDSLNKGVDTDGKKFTRFSYFITVFGLWSAVLVDFSLMMAFIQNYREEIFNTLSWIFWAIVITAVIIGAFYLLVKIIKSNQEEKEREQQRIHAILQQRRKEKKEKEAQEEINKLSQELKEAERRVLNQLYTEKIEALALLEAKNKQLAEDVETLKYAVSGISIYDDDFLDQQPKILEYINDAIAQGKV